MDVDQFKKLVRECHDSISEYEDNDNMSITLSTTARNTLTGEDEDLDFVIRVKKGRDLYPILKKLLKCETQKQILTIFDKCSRGKQTEFLMHLFD